MDERALSTAIRAALAHMHAVEDAKRRVDNLTAFRDRMVAERDYSESLYALSDREARVWQRRIDEAQARLDAQQVNYDRLVNLHR